MIKAEFGIIDTFRKNKLYSEYEPQKYHCVAIDDDVYINDWWHKLMEIDTFNMSLKQPQKALSRWGITIIPPESLPTFLMIVENDRRFYKDPNLVALSNLVRQAISKNKYMIHFGV